MRKHLLVVPMLAMVCFACSGEQPNDVLVTATEGISDIDQVAVDNDLHLPGGKVVRDVEWNSETHTASVILDAGTVSIKQATVGDLPVGVSYELRSPSGGLMFEVAIGSDEDRAVFWVNERTASDEMTMIRWVRERTVTEKYVLNGEELVVTYPDLPQEFIDKAVLHYKAGRYDSFRDHMELFDALAAFDEFYTPRMQNTLHWNSDGELLAAVASSEELANMIVANGEGTHERPDKVWAYTCSAAGACVFLKCPFFGPANMLCDLCTGIAVLCIMAPFILP